MFPTKNDLPESTRQNVISLLQKRLADGVDLTYQAKHAHWNIRGPHFIALHELFDKIHEEIEDCTDVLAERIAQFGGLAEGTIEAASKNSSLPKFPTMVGDVEEYVEILSSSLAAFAKNVRQGIEQTTQWHDAGTADILTQISRSVDKNLWFVESHLAQQKAGVKSVKDVA